MRNNRRKSNRKKEYSIIKKIPKQVLISTVVIILFLFFSVIFALTNSINQKVMARTKVNGVDLSNKTIDEAYKTLNEELDKQLNKNIILKYEDYETTISLKQLEVKYKTDEAVNKAYKIGRDRNILKSNYQIIFSFLFGNNIEEEIKIDEQELDIMIEDIEAKMPSTLIQNDYYIEGNKLIISRGTPGTVIKRDELHRIIVEAIKEQIHGKNVGIINIPVENKLPDEIDIEKIYEEIYKEPQNAYYEEKPVRVYAEVNGVDFELPIEEIKQQLKEEKEEYVIPLKITKPEVTIKDLQYTNNFFPDQLSKFSTRYSETNENRANNMKLSAEKINGTILMPGEEFSYNKIVGARTIKAGYKEAAVYMGGKVVNGIGGGICQVSSTLYNAVLQANLEITARKNHHFITSYVSPSRDATVSYGSIDFKFKNTRTYPIKIECSAKNGVCQVQIYGIKEDVEYEVEIIDTVTEVIPYETRYIETNELETGTEQLVQTGTNGYKSEAYRVLKLNGKIISKTLLSKDSYNPLEEIIKKGK